MAAWADTELVRPPRSHVCVCGHRLLEHALSRDHLAPGGPYHWGRCLVVGCLCHAALNETGSIDERAGA
jgi:hypothetical protein